MAAGLGEQFAAANVSQSTYGGSALNLGFPGMGAISYLAKPATPGTVFDVHGNVLSSTANPQLINSTPTYTGNPGYYGGNNGQGNNVGTGAAASSAAGWMNSTQ